MLKYESAVLRKKGGEIKSLKVLLNVSLLFKKKKSHKAIPQSQEITW